MSLSATILAVVTGIVALIGAVITVVARRPLRAAVGLLIHIIALSAMFLTLHAQLLAAIQLLVYAGAVVVLFVFVIMLIGPAAEVGRSERAVATRTIGAVVVATLFGVIASAVGGFESAQIALPEGYGSLESMGRAIYQGALVPFELVSVTLLVAIVGATAVARGRSAAETKAAAHRSLPQPVEQEVSGE